MKTLFIGLGFGILINTIVQLIFQFPLQISIPNGVVIGIVTMLITLKIEDAINKKKWKKIREADIANFEPPKEKHFKIIPENIIYLTQENDK